jgi:predicted ABC-type ATPase
MAWISPSQPLFIVLAGPNGSGKSTSAATLLPPTVTFVNADEIAKDLSGYPSNRADVEAGRIALERMDQLAASRSDFAIETTLASRSLAVRAERLKRAGYHFRLLFLWSPSPDLSIARVASRVIAGGHNVPEEVIRRRYRAGLINFRELYRPLADSWMVYDNTRMSGPEPIAEGRGLEVTNLARAELWTGFDEEGPR